MKNTDLKQTYDKMHAEGKQAWFDSGDEERHAIFKMGEPWNGKTVLEIGCGEGDLLSLIEQSCRLAMGVDYSEIAREKATEKYPHLMIYDHINRLGGIEFDILVMQGVMEHLDHPFASLGDMIVRFKPKTVIASMPCFLNIRGIIWHTLDMLGAVMSKTDLHYIDPWEVREFCDKHGYRLRYDSIEQEWGNGRKMIDDLSGRLPLAIKDGKLLWDINKFASFMIWLEKALEYFDHDEGAINIYRIDI